jgi:hypothetical protein
MEPWGIRSFYIFGGTWVVLMFVVVGEKRSGWLWGAFALLLFVACEAAFPQLVPFNAWLMVLIFVPIRVAFAFRSFLHDMMPWMKWQARKEREAKKKERERKRYLK